MVCQRAARCQLAVVMHTSCWEGGIPQLSTPTILSSKTQSRHHTLKSLTYIAAMTVQTQLSFAYLSVYLQNFSSSYDDTLG